MILVGENSLPPLVFTRDVLEVWHASWLIWLPALVLLESTTTAKISIWEILLRYCWDPYYYLMVSTTRIHPLLLLIDPFGIHTSTVIVVCPSWGGRCSILTSIPVYLGKGTWTWCNAPNFELTTYFQSRGDLVLHKPRISNSSLGMDRESRAIRFDKYTTRFRQETKELWHLEVHPLGQSTHIVCPRKSMIHSHLRVMFIL